jgi:hypothetical protein
MQNLVTVRGLFASSAYNEVFGNEKFITRYANKET